MSLRTLIEINHDFLGDPHALGEAIVHTLSAMEKEADNRAVTIISTRHHQDGHRIVGSDGYEVREISWDPEARDLRILRSDNVGSGLGKRLMGVIMRDHAANEAAARDPQPGDLWHEMCCGVCLVVERTGDKVRVCWDKEDVPGNRYVFVRPMWTSVSAFGRRLRYDTNDRYWADICRRGIDVSSYQP